MPVKICEFCKKEFDYEVGNFGRGRSRKFCSKNCSYNSYYNKNKEKFSEKRKEYSKGNPKRFMLHGVKCRAKKLGIEFDLEESDVEIPETCPVLGVPLVSKKGESNVGDGPSSYAPSIDRIDHTKGYVKGNIRVISVRANMLKGNATVEELELVVEDLKKLKTL